MKKVLILAGCLFLLVGCDVFVPPDYESTVKTGGPIEAAYLKAGRCAVTSYRIPAQDPKLGFHVVYHPADLATRTRPVPAVIFANGSGVIADKYPALFQHLASWDFIVVGNNAENAGNGASSDKAMAFLLAENDRPDSPLYHKVDLDHLGISGHSQGGAGVFNAITDARYGTRYTAAVALSPVHEELAEKLKWTYPLAQVQTPTLMMAGTTSSFELNLVIPPQKLREMYRKLKCPKAMARKVDCDHGHMLYRADGYVTAWFMWLLQNDPQAGCAFTGPAPEIRTNSLYQDVATDCQDIPRHGSGR